MRVILNSKNISSCKDRKVTAPPSKSAAHRLLIASALAKSGSEISCLGTSDDIEMTANCLNEMGADIRKDEKKGVFYVDPIKLSCKEKAYLDVGESGSTLRFLIPVLGALGLEAEIKMRGRLPERPLEPLKSLLESKGMEIKKISDDVLCVKGKIQSGIYKIDGGVSSQFISGLLFALPLLEGESEIRIEGKRESKPYIDMTLQALELFGVRTVQADAGYIIESSYGKGGKHKVEGDYSGAAFMLCLGALLEEGITVAGLDKDSKQGDKEILRVLKDFGASVEYSGEEIKVKKAPMKGIKIDSGDIPDLVPIMSVVAAAAEGESLIYNAGRLRIKESDRLKATADILKTLGVEIYEGEDSLRIVGGKHLRGGACDGYGDHRMVMSAAVASFAASGEVSIYGAEAISKSYPLFFEDLEKMGISVIKEDV
ncbi:MAG: 3-phosphoshikimate 1-carboxyvinyltransferase [Ruminococcaceae bacterium]|nr:3-phosphoshikimate 1-carboxyvinyltransferase [Oscillospiraceae bacterium]